MTAFQSTVQFNNAFGVIGELYSDSPVRAAEYILNSSDATQNVIGRAFTVVSQQQAQAGGTGVFAGILADPKAYASYGTTAAGTLAPTLQLPNGTNAQMVSMGQIVVTLPGAATIGDPVAYNTSTGVLSSYAAKTTFTGVIAVTTGVLTISALATGGYVSTNSALSGTGVPVGTRITSQLTGTLGGNGTYQTNITTAVASFTDGSTDNNALSLGSTFARVPNTVVALWTPSAAGLAVIQLTN